MTRLRRRLVTAISAVGLLGTMLGLHAGLAATPVHAALASLTDVNPNVSTSSDADATTGGRVNHLATVAGNNQVYYAASEQGGLFKTTDRGANWQHLDSHLPQQTWDVKTDPGNASRVYATSFYDGRVASLSGIEVSQDAGATWSHPASATPPSSATCGTAITEPSGFGIGIRPDATQNVYVGTNCGVARSTDSGATWSFVNQAAGTVWAVLVQSGGPNGQGIVDICGSGGFQSSTDGGTTWTNGAGLPAGRCSLAASPDESYVLFAAASDNQAWESDDAGANWTAIGANANFRQGRIPFVKTNKRASNFDLWFGDVSLFRDGCTTPNPAKQGGALRCPGPSSWAGPYTRSVGGHDDLGDIVFDSQANVDACPELFSSDGGAHVNTNTASPGCQTPSWNRSNNGLHALWTWGMTGSRSGSGLNLFFGAQDDGFQAASHADTTPNWNNPQCCDVFSAATDSNRVVITECCFTKGPGTQVLVGNASGTSFSGVPNYPPGGEIPQPEGDPDGGGVVGFSSTGNLVNFADKQYALMTSSGLFFTTDITANPITWTQIGAATSPASPCGVQVAISGGTPTFFLQAGSCASTVGGSLWKHSGTGTGSWTQIDTNDGQSGGIGIFGVAGSDPNRLYASNLAFNGPRMVSSTDGGQTWNADPTLDRMMTGNGAFPYLNQTGPTNFTSFKGYAQPTLLAFDPANPSLIVAGGHDSGIFMSGDGGNSWGQATDPGNGATNLTQPRFAYFDRSGGQLKGIYVGTQGHGVWRLVTSPSALAYTGPTSGDFNDSVTLRARLTDASVSPAAPIGGATVKFTLGSQTCSGSTDGGGNASCSLVLNQAPGTYTLTTTFGGDGTRLASTQTQTFAVTSEDTALTYTGDTTADFHDSAHVSARLIDPTDNLPIAGKSISFDMGAGDSCSGTTDGGGSASCVIVPTQAAGTVSLGVSFGGDGSFQPANTTAAFTITKEETATAYTGPPVIANGQSVTLSGVLKEDGIVPIGGRTLTFTLGSGASAQTCTGTTDGTGAASCTIASVSQPLNGTATVPVTVSFGGDPFYRPSSSTATLRLQFMTGRAYGLSASVNALGLPVAGVPPTPDTGQVRTASASSTNTPCTASVNAIVVTAHALCANVTTTLAPGTSTATASVSDATIGIPGLPVISVSGVQAASHTTCGSASGTVTLTLTIAGVPTTVSLAPNSVIDLGVAKIILNEQTPVAGADFGLTVNAVHIIASGLVNANVVVGSATSDIHNCA